MLSRSVFVWALVGDPLSPAPAGGFGAAAPLVGGVAELQGQYFGQDSIVQPLAHRAVAGAGTTHAGPRNPRPLDQSLGAQRVKVKTHRRRVQAKPCGEFRRIDRFVVLAYQLKNSLALPVLCCAMRPPGLVSAVLLAHPIRPLVRLPSSYFEDIIH